MILSDGTIRQYLKDGIIGIDPLTPEQIQPASVDIRLGDTYSIVEDSSNSIIHLGSPVPYRTLKASTYLLLPGQFVLATTMEYFRLPDHIPKKLQDLMYPNLASEEEVMEAVYQRGYFPRNTPFQNLPQDFVDGVLIGAWPQVMNMIREMRSKYNIPFKN